MQISNKKNAIYRRENANLTDCIQLQKYYLICKYFKVHFYVYIKLKIVLWPFENYSRCFIRERCTSVSFDRDVPMQPMYVCVCVCTFYIILYIVYKENPLQIEMFWNYDFQVQILYGLSVYVFFLCCCCCTSISFYRTYA